MNQITVLTYFYSTTGLSLWFRNSLPSRISRRHGLQSSLQKKIRTNYHNKGSRFVTIGCNVKVIAGASTYYTSRTCPQLQFGCIVRGLVRSVQCLKWLINAATQRKSRRGSLLFVLTEWTCRSEKKLITDLYTQRENCWQSLWGTFRCTHCQSF